MKYCFIIAISRLEYYNLQKIIEEIDEEVKFILITDDKYIKNIEKSVVLLFHNVCIAKNISIEFCENVINQYHIEDFSKVCIVCSNEKLLMMCANLREKFRINGSKPYQYVPFISKRTSKQILAFSGVNVCYPLDFNGKYTKNNLKEYNEFLFRTLSGSYVIKPLDGGGSENTAIINSYKDLFLWHESSFDLADEYIVEKFVDGTLYHCDSFIFNGEIQFSAVSKYISPNLDFTKGIALGSYPVLDKFFVDKAIKFNKKIIKSLNTPDGATHLEFFESNGKMIFLEMAARAPGKSVVKCHEMNFGINFYELVLRMELGLEMNFLPKYNLFHGWVCVPIKAGKVRKLYSPKISSKYSIDWEIKEGEVLERFPRSLKEGTAASIMVFNTDYDTLIKDIEYFKNNNIFDVE